MLRMLRKTFYQTVTLGGRNANFDGLACTAGRSFAARPVSVPGDKHVLMGSYTKAICDKAVCGLVVAALGAISQCSPRMRG